MKQHVILYSCRARFAGVAEVPYDQAPEVGAFHDCILFVCQASPEPDFAAASDILIRKHGWGDLEMKRAGPLQPEAVNSAQMSFFQHYYEECLEHGDSLAWYA